MKHISTQRNMLKQYKDICVRCFPCLSLLLVPCIRNSLLRLSFAWTIRGHCYQAREPTIQHSSQQQHEETHTHTEEDASKVSTHCGRRTVRTRTMVRTTVALVEVHRLSCHHYDAHPLACLSFPSLSSVEARSVAQIKAEVVASQSALPDAPVGAKLTDLKKYTRVRTHNTHKHNKQTHKQTRPTQRAIWNRQSGRAWMDDDGGDICTCVQLASPHFKS